MNIDTLEAKLVASAGAKGVPVSGSLELLPLCNFNCRMCYVRLSRSGQEEIQPLVTTEEWIRIADQLQEAGTLFLTITGGEPLLYPGFRELYLHLQRLGFFLTLNTNGSLINDDWVEFFRKNQPRRINITLYGGSSETYGKLCQAPEAFPRVLEGIRKLKEAGLAVKLNISLSAGNYQEYDRMLALAEELECPVSVDTYMQPAVRERKKAYDFSSRMSPEEAAALDLRARRESEGEEFRSYADSVLSDIRARREEFCRSKLYGPEGGQPEWSGSKTGQTESGGMGQTDREKVSQKASGLPENKREGMRCRAGKTSFVITWQGLVRPCVMLPQPEISVLSKDFRSCWQELQEGCRKIYFNEKCSVCPYLKVCQICPAAGMHEVSSADGRPEYLCRYTEEYVRLLEEEIRL